MAFGGLGLVFLPTLVILVSSFLFLDRSLNRVGLDDLDLLMYLTVYLSFLGPVGRTDNETYTTAVFMVPVLIYILIS